MLQSIASTRGYNTDQKVELVHAWIGSTVLLMREHSHTDILTDGSPGERLVSLDEARHRLMNITRRELYNRINAGDLKSAKLGRRRGIVESSLDAYIARLIDDEEKASGQVPA